MSEKEYAITEGLAAMIEEASALEDMVISLSKRARSANICFWKGVYLLHPELESSDIKLNYNNQKRLVVTSDRHHD